ncbi:diacylglycerol kinase [Alteromonas sp. ASW11-19]|uniref:Diacylglycerol kinase n=1 Tax=Alteromonas salexigens TaxID=2982530 RepID=A0ABT2VMN8_9ALTE|nr:diacylglycerol kinase [Alteromonas salexigens]MCU7554138.1 diacylglycerol kinase [Alteromonas salexigens]
MKTKNTGFVRLYFATIYSVKGLIAAFKSEGAVRQELAVMLILIPIALVLEVSLAERILLVASLVIVLIAELLNTAIESLADRVSTEIHVLIAKAKDIGSAAVFVALMLAVFTWGAILYNYFTIK